MSENVSDQADENITWDAELEACLVLASALPQNKHMGALRDRLKPPSQLSAVSAPRSNHGMMKPSVLLFGQSSFVVHSRRATTRVLQVVAEVERLLVAVLMSI